jgi:hypothetical protein
MAVPIKAAMRPRGSLEARGGDAVSESRFVLMVLVVMREA